MAYLFELSELKGITPFSEIDETNLAAFYKPDVMSGSFVLNEFGWPRSDIAVLNEMSSVQEAQAMLQRLGEMPSISVNDGLSDVEIMLSHRSKYQQTPSEVTSYIERQLQIREANAMKKASDDSIKFDDDDKKVSDSV